MNEVTDGLESGGMAFGKIPEPRAPEPPAALPWSKQHFPIQQGS